MSSISSLSVTGALVGEPTRTMMLVTLMDGRALTAGELARASGVTPATASAHLAQLIDGGLLTVAKQGRHRYFQVATPGVAQMIESMMGVAAVADAARRARFVRSGPADQALRRARQCYDHLAGAIAVQLADFLVGSGYLDWSIDAASLTPTGVDFLDRLGIAPEGGAIEQISGQRRRVYCRPCMDWSERRPHVAGALGSSLLRLFLDRHWLRRSATGRALVITPPGADALQRNFGIR